MYTKRLILIAAIGIVIQASAFTTNPGNSTDGLKSRRDAVKTGATVPGRIPAMQHVATSPERAAGKALRVAPRQTEAENPYARYGELIPVLEEDFSKMTSGSKGAPDFNTKIWNDQMPGDDSYIPWTNIKPEYTHVPDWGGYNVFQAGGMVYIDQTTDYTHLNTPYNTDLTANNGICVLTFDVASIDDKHGISGILIEGADTRGMGSTWTFLESQMTPELAPGEYTINCLFYGAGSTTLFNIMPAGMEAFYLDNLRIYTLKQHIATPIPLAHSEYKGTSFKANWEAVDGAEGYLVSVYSLDDSDPTNPVINYVAEDKPAKENSLVVEGVESGVTYYYTVKSVKGEHTSLPSVAMRVFDIETPVMLAPELSENGVSYKARWNASPMAERYNYIAFKQRKADADGPFVIADEQFTGITDIEGLEYDWTFDDPDPESLTYDDFYIGTGMMQRGWHALHAINYYNSLCIDAFHYFYGGENAGLISPELDLGKDGGKATVTINAAGEFFTAEQTGVTDLNGNPVDLQVEAAVAVFNYDETTGDYRQDELIYAHDVNKEGMSSTEMREFTFNITKGSERSIIGIYAVGGPGNLYLDDFRIVQNYKAGETFFDPFEFDHWYEGTQISIEVPSHAYGHDIYDQVQAVRSVANYGMAEFAVSDFSPRAFVFSSTSGVNDVEADADVAIELNSGILNVNAKGTVRVYGIDGRPVAGSATGSGFTCKLPAKGIYFVRTTDRAVKIIY